MRHFFLLRIDAKRCAYPHFHIYLRIFAHICAYMREYGNYPHHSAFAKTAWPWLVLTPPSLVSRSQQSSLQATFTYYLSPVFRIDETTYSLLWNSNQYVSIFHMLLTAFEMIVKSCHPSLGVGKLWTLYVSDFSLKSVASNEFVTLKFFSWIIYGGLSNIDNISSCHKNLPFFPFSLWKSQSQFNHLISENLVS